VRLYEYIHALVFAVWMLVFEENPWPTLTVAMSLEAIFLSTLVMIGQNRQAAFQQAKADHDYQDVDAGRRRCRRSGGRSLTKGCCPHRSCR
jgi:uncharacterized membrane protein